MIYSFFVNIIGKYGKRIEDENKENITLIWFDPNIRSCEDIEKKKQELHLINDYVLFHTDLQQCITIIQSIDKEKNLLNYIRVMYTVNWFMKYDSSACVSKFSETNYTEYVNQWRSTP